MIDPAFLTEFAMKLAPELRAAPLYIFGESDFPLPGSLGITFKKGFPFELFDLLVARGEWRGPGPAIVLTEEKRPRGEFLGTFIHELAHNLPAKPIPWREPTPEARRRCTQLIAEWNAAVNEPPPAGVLRWFPEHGREFTRIVLHLWWRAALQGEFIPSFDFCGGRRYDMSPGSFYWRVLGSEPVEMKDATFAEILARPEPSSFTGVWLDDLAYFTQQIRNQTVSEAAA